VADASQITGSRPIVAGLRAVVAVAPMPSGPRRASSRCMWRATVRLEAGSVLPLLENALMPWHRVRFDNAGVTERVTGPIRSNSLGLPARLDHLPPIP
jgi:hypothetical protein